MFKIFHNPRCKHSRMGLEFLKEKSTDFEVREYLKDPITKDEITEILKKSGLGASELVRTQEDYFKKELKGKSFTTDEWIEILTHNPKLLKRPIVVGNSAAVVASPPEEINRLF